jgi:catechol 2,3-dioxygenase-like lactoylglutathione lyase family enzyme
MQLKRIDHLSLTVGDIERSAHFYERFGLRPLKRYVSAGPHVDRAVETERADMDIQWLGHPEGGPMLELIRYLHHPAEPAAHNSKVGAAHVCLAVEDLAVAHAELRDQGVRFLSEPNQDEFGVRWVYSRDPDGNIVELIQDPPGEEAAL